MTPLLMAAATGPSDVVQELISARADAGAKTFDGKTILDLTSKNNMALCKFSVAAVQLAVAAITLWQSIPVAFGA